MMKNGIVKGTDSSPPERLNQAYDRLKNPCAKVKLDLIDVINDYNEQAKFYDQDNAMLNWKGPQYTSKYIQKYLPNRDSHILDMCAGSGEVAEFLRTSGYTNIEYLDGSKEMVKIAADKDLYTSYLLQLIPEDGPTLLQSETFDAAVISGGHISPGKCNELLRITKPDGYIIMATVLVTKQDALEFDQVVKYLEGEQEHRDFTFVERLDVDAMYTDNEGNGIEGYVVVLKKKKKHSVQSFEMNGVDEQDDKQKLQDLFKKYAAPCEKEKDDLKDVVREYEDVAKEYTEDMQILQWRGPEYAAKLALKHVPNRASQILDMCGGTGEFGRIMHAKGYRNMDNLDGSGQMVKVSIDSGNYRTNIVQLIPEDGPTVLRSDMYDCAIMSGGHISPGKIDELIRVTKTGGYLILCAVFLTDVDVKEFDDVKAYLQKVEKSKKLKFVEIEKCPSMILDENGAGKPGEAIALIKT